MKLTNARALLIGIIFSTGLSLTACKGKSKGEETTPATTAPAQQPTEQQAPVQITADDPLKDGVKDATKDFPGVNAEVANGEITLTGDIERSRLPTLMQSLNSLRPKKINNQLTIK